MNILQSYREASIGGANPVQLVVQLYEQLIEDIRQVALAIEQNNIRLRTDRVRHAILVIGHLQSSLDFSRGGKVARDLDNFYNSLRQSVVAVQFSPSKPAADQLITDLLALRESWTEVERAEYPRLSSAPPIPSPDAPLAQPGGTDEAVYAATLDSREDVRNSLHLDRNG